jgi:hypothetical protein
MAMTLMLLAGCDAHGDRPSTLMDGSRAHGPGVDLDGVSSPAIATKVLVRPAKTARAGSKAASCIRAQRAQGRPRGAVVQRVGVESSTVTYVSDSGLHGCDNSRGRREGDRRWCGTSFGVLKRGRLDDPRLDIAGCGTDSGAPMGFAWITASRARYVAVAQDGYSEIYEPAGGIPIRIATATGIEVDGSRATFRVSEHDAQGRLLRCYELDAVPAG